MALTFERGGGRHKSDYIIHLLSDLLQLNYTYIFKTLLYHKKTGQLPSLNPFCGSPHSPTAILLISSTCSPQMCLVSPPTPSCIKAPNLGQMDRSQLSLYPTMSLFLACLWRVFVSLLWVLVFSLSLGITHLLCVSCSGPDILPLFSVLYQVQNISTFTSRF